MSQPEEAARAGSRLDVGDVEEVADPSLRVRGDVTGELGLFSRRGCCHLNKKTASGPPMSRA